MTEQTNIITNPVLEQALYLLEEKGWSVIPVGRNKKPVIDWKRFQTTRATKDEVVSWFEKNPHLGLGVVTGQISGIVVIDIDPRHGGNDKDFRGLTTIESQTGGGGWHFYFKYEDGIENKAGIREGIDVRGEGGYVVVPPSGHESGKNYEWINNPKHTSILPLPDFVKKWIGGNGSKTENKTAEIIKGVSEGQRNDSAASMAGKLLVRFPPENWESEAWPLLQGWNKNNIPPLPGDELRSVFDSIKEDEAKKEKKKGTVALQIVEKIEEESIVFFHDQNKEGFAATNGDGREILKIRSRAFKQYLARLVYENLKRVVSANTLSDVVQMLEGKAIFDGSQHDLYARIVKQENNVWYDLGDGPAVYICESGWSISETPPILFRRYPHQRLQIKPQPGGNLKDLINFINLSTENQKLLFLVYTVAAFIPDFPHPILVLYGPQGAGKSTPQRLLKCLIDPSAIKTLSSPDNIREFVQLASHHYFLFLDNLSSLPGWLSDALARACTGDGFTKRELFSDDDDIIYSFQRTICLNGINLVIGRADLLDRCILLPLERIPKDKRRKEKDFWDEFEAKRPYFLGAIFDAVAGALKEYPNVCLDSYPRMADFSAWGVAIAKVLGYTQKEFLTAYWENVGQQNEAALEASNVATTIIALMAEREKWEGTASDLLAELEKVAEQIKINTKAKDWPKDPSWLSRRIQLVSTNLAEDGIKIERDEKSRPKKIIIEKITENVDSADIPSPAVKTETKPDLTPTVQLPLDGDKDADKVDGHFGQSVSTTMPPSAYSEEMEVDSGDREEGAE